MEDSDKIKILSKLRKLEHGGIHLTKHYTVTDDLAEMEAEYHFLKMRQGIDNEKKQILSLITLSLMLNETIKNKFSINILEDIGNEFIKYIEKTKTCENADIM